MQIREASSLDIPTLIDFQLKMALETENIQLEISTLTQGVQRLLKDPSKGKYYVAQDAQEIVGCLMTTYEWSDWRCGTILWIQSVYVAEKWRRKKVFRKLYEHIQSMVNQDPNLKGIRLYVDKGNQAAHQTYDGIGMNGQHYGVFEWMKN